MAQVRLVGLSKRFGRTEVVQSVDLEVHDHELLVLLGPAGSGKSTLLRMIAGLEEPTSGDIYIGERRVNELSPKDRDVATVFQNYALSPHMTVYDNMAVTLRLSKLPLSEIDRRVREAAEMLGIAELLARKPGHLSGVQRQRVALGRAVVRKPTAFLMDEPLSNLDPKLRAQIEAELVALHKRLGITTLYVTHDQTEAMALADRIAVIRNGVIQQCDSPQAILDHPANRFIAGFIGSPPMNFVQGVLIETAGALWLEAPPLHLRFPEATVTHVGIRERIGESVIFGIRPNDIYDASVPGDIPSEGNTVEAMVEVVEPLGEQSLVYLRVGDHSLIACLDSVTWAADGEALRLVLDMTRAHLFDADTGESII